MELKQTPLHAWHLDAGAKLTAFAGWHMPLVYTSQVEEHLRTRTSASLFDVSHMGQIEIQGQEATPFCDWLLPNTVAGLASRANYHPLCREDGTVVDDLLLYPMADDHYLLCVNAVNCDKDHDFIGEQAKVFGFQGQIQNVSHQFAQIAVQGPQAVSLIKAMNPDWAELKRFRFTVPQTGWIVSRTGYTGEDGFELYLPPSEVVSVWQSFLSLAEEHHIDCKPAGLAARDTLRLEAGLPLYGHELDDHHTAVQSGLSMFCKTDRKPFCGSEVLNEQKKHPPQTQLVGFRSESKRAPRQGQMLVDTHGHEIGGVVSGAYGPSIGVGIGTGFISVDRQQIWAVSSHGRLPLHVCELPFWKRQTSSSK